MSESDFTIASYRRLIRTALDSGYHFLKFDDPGRHSESPVCLLRHDIDTDLQSAVQLAESEAELGVRSTYFLMLRSPVYNLLSRANHRMVEQICSMGHWIGLHYDAAFQPGHIRRLNTLVHMEAQVLQQMFGVRISVVSFHQPGPDVIENRITLDGYINTYNTEDLPNFHYVSDSNKQWKSEHPTTLFANRTYEQIHLLIHPMWWAHADNLPTETVWDHVLANNRRLTEQQLLDTERAYGSPRQLQIEPAD